MAEERKPFKRTDKQIEATKLAKMCKYLMLFGGSRSGKTFTLVRNVIIRAASEPNSKHLIARLHFTNAKRAIAQETLPEVNKKCFPDLPIHLNKTDWVFTLPNGSTIWIAGTETGPRLEKILGTEFSTIYFNECSQFLDYDIILKLLTRLAEKNSLKNKAYFDCNPPGKKHWTYQLFFEHKQPIGGEPIPYPEEYGHLIMNPTDNQENIDEDYIKMLKSQPKRHRERFLEGKFLSDIEGALWTDRMISAAKIKIPGEIVKTIVVIDPSVSDGKDSDECGMHVISLDENGEAVVQKDLSLKASTKTWAETAVNAYYEYEANEIVAEVNQGGDLVEDAIKAVDPKVVVKKVRASKGKKARAEPVAALYELGKVSHAETMPETEAELTEWVPDKNMRSPNRLDSLVWGITWLMLAKNKRNVRVLTA